MNFNARSLEVSYEQWLPLVLRTFLDTQLATYAEKYITVGGFRVAMKFN